MENKVDAILNENIQRVNSSSKKENKKFVDQYLCEIKEFESDRVELAKRSAKNSRIVAFIFAIFAFISMISVMLLTPLKTTELQIIKINDSDASIELINPLQDEKQITYGEVLDKYWARKYINARNSYDWENIQDNFNLVVLMSNKIVANDYKNFIYSKKSPVEIFEDNKRIKVNVNDVSFLPSSDNSRQLAQIRFSRDIYEKNGKVSNKFKTTYWNATITFDYKAKIQSEDDRTLNPLGFRVLTYNEERVL